MNVGTVPYLSYNELSVADSDPFVTDPDPDFHFDTDPDPAFQFGTDPDPCRFKQVMYLKQYFFTSLLDFPCQ